MDYYEITEICNGYNEYDVSSTIYIHLYSNTEKIDWEEFRKKYICNILVINRMTRGCDYEWEYDTHESNPKENYPLVEFLKSVSPNISFLDYVTIKEQLVEEFYAEDIDYYIKHELKIEAIETDKLIEFMKKEKYIV